MSKTLREAALSTQNSRRSLLVGVHWRGINADVHLGYRKQKRGGKWLARWYIGDGKYQQATVGTADDGQLTADGVGCLSFEQAKAKVAQYVSARRTETLANAYGPAPTVGSVVREHITAQDRRDLLQRGEMGRRGDARLRLTKHVLSKPIAEVPLHSLVEDDLSKWRSKLPDALASATVRRIVNDFRAALNAGAARYRAQLPADVPVIIKNGLAAGEDEGAAARDKAILADADIRRVVEAAKHVDDEGNWGGDLFRLIVTLTATGGRFSQVARMCVGDVQSAQQRLMVPTSRKGRGKKKSTHTAVRVGADVIDVLRPAMAGRREKDPLLERWRHSQVAADETAPARWTRNARGHWRFAAEMARPWLEITKRAGLPVDVVPYALRHSSIVRQLRQGLPVRLVAALHDTSTRMIETHYSWAIVDALDDLAASAVISLVSSEGEKLVSLRAGQ